MKDNNGINNEKKNMEAIHKITAGPLPPPLALAPTTTSAWTLLIGKPKKKKINKRTTTKNKNRYGSDQPFRHPKSNDKKHEEISYQRPYRKGWRGGVLMSCMTVVYDHSV